jgi:hypothetical protein
VSDLAELLVQDAEAWHAWLESHHADHPGVVGMVLHKKGGHATTARGHKLVKYVDMLARREYLHPHKDRQ